jgi:protocatechuate 3,4-dioxygenase beta subunit
VPEYRSTLLRAPRRLFVAPPRSEAERHAPLFGEDRIRPEDADLTRQAAGDPLGERIVVSGRVTDRSGRPVAGRLVEIWQANAAGRYAHPSDVHPAPLDPNFAGAGRCLTAGDGSFRFVTVKPGAYPWLNHPNAWRPAHIHFSLFGRGFAERLVTQMYFPGDPLFDLDPILQAVVDPRARARLIATYDHDLTVPEWSTGYRWDIVLTGPHRTPTEDRG